MDGETCTWTYTLKSKGLTTCAALLVLSASLTVCTALLVGHRLEFLSDDSLQGIIDATSRMIEELSQAVRKLRSDEWYNTKVRAYKCTG